MSTLISRLYSWATDKTNNVKITAARMDAENDQIITALNRKVLCAASAPDSPIAGQSWYDTTNKILKIYRNNEWVSMGGLHVATTAPDNPIEGDLWFETDTNLLKAYDGAAWLEFPISIDGFDEKTALVAGDLFLIEDSEDTNAKKKVQASNIMIEGACVQRYYKQVEATASGTNTIPIDDTIPAVGEMNLFITADAYTPKSATNILEIDVWLNLSSSTGARLHVGLSADDGSNICALSVQEAYTPDELTCPLKFFMVAGTTSPLTFKCYGASNSGTTYLNSDTGSARYGGVWLSGISIKEYKA